MPNIMLPATASRLLKEASNEAVKQMNCFSSDVLRTRGGRIGSGMGSLLEALWGYNVNAVLKRQGGTQVELAWMYGHTYNDFALVKTDSVWNPESREGELLRVEAKSMVVSADESKAHFDQIQKYIGVEDLLVVLIWDWCSSRTGSVSPLVKDFFIGNALAISKLRDALHLQRGGSFVNGKNCPDGCSVSSCTHDGEPLNEAGKRERVTGPESTRVSTKVSFASNFGGMVRMLKTNNDNARNTFRFYRRNCNTCHEYISFIHRNLPKEEINQYPTTAWKNLAKKLCLDISGSLNKQEIVNEVRKCKGYMEQLRDY